MQSGEIVEAFRARGHPLGVQPHNWCIAAIDLTLDSQPRGGGLAMDAQTPSIASAKRQLLERQAECRHMSTLRSLPAERRREFEKMADRWARLAEAMTEE
jgi:hypothetical protein